MSVSHDKSHQANQRPQAKHTNNSSRFADGLDASNFAAQADSTMRIFEAATVATLPVKSMIECSATIMRGSFGAFHHFLEANQISRRTAMVGVTGMHSPLDATAITEVQRDVSEYFKRIVDNEFLLIADLMNVATEAVSQLQSGARTNPA